MEKSNKYEIYRILLPFGRHSREGGKCSIKCFSRKNQSPEGGNVQ